VQHAAADRSHHDALGQAQAARTEDDQFGLFLFGDIDHDVGRLAHSQPRAHAQATTGQFGGDLVECLARVVDLGLIHVDRGAAYAQCGAAHHRHDDSIDRAVQHLQLIDRLVRMFRTVVGHHNFHRSLPAR
jgi:hypothetical protein